MTTRAWIGRLEGKQVGKEVGKNNDSVTAAV